MNTSLLQNELHSDLPIVLVVENDRSMRSMLCQAIEQDGYRVVPVAGAEQCLAIYESIRPDVVVLNTMLPGVDGFTCCAQLQASRSNPPPVLMMTSLEDLETIDRIFAVGAMDYITKPIRLVVLRQRIRRLLQTNRIMEELRQQTQREHLVKAITLKIRQSLDLDQNLSTSVTEVRAFLNADRVALYQINPGRGGTFVVESVKPGWTPVLGIPLVDPCFDEEYASQYRQGRVSATNDIYQADLPDCYVELLARIEIQANLIVPVVYKDELWGLLCAHQCSAARHWESFEVELLCQLANQMAIAIQQSRLFRQLEEANQHLQLLVSSDGLTQVANRRYFDEYLAQEWQRMSREATPLSLILCDIDYFKAYNDAYGHPAGDNCLQQVAIALSESIKRPADLVARYGGEEFAVILPNTGIEGAVQVAEAIRTRVRDLELVQANTQVSQYVTLSVGIACTVPRPARTCPQGEPSKAPHCTLLHPESSPAALIAAADRALYQAKAAGRNTVRVATYKVATYKEEREFKAA